MTDLCERCVCRDDVAMCENTVCNQHEKWIVVRLKADLAAMTKAKEEAEAERIKVWDCSVELSIQRDETLAYAEKLRDAVAYYSHQCDIRGGNPDAGWKRIGKVLETPPPAALAELKQEIRNETIDSVLDKLYAMLVISPDGGVAATLRQMKE